MYRRRDLHAYTADTCDVNHTVHGKDVFRTRDSWHLDSFQQSLCKAQEADDDTLGKQTPSGMCNAFSSCVSPCLEIFFGKKFLFCV